MRVVNYRVRGTRSVLRRIEKSNRQIFEMVRGKREIEGLKLIDIDLEKISENLLFLRPVAGDFFIC